MVPMPGDELIWSGRYKWTLESPLRPLGLEDKDFADEFKYCANAVEYMTRPSGARGIVYFEELDITPQNSRWRFVDPEFLVFVKHTLSEAKKTEEVIETSGRV